MKIENEWTSKCYGPNSNTWKAYKKNESGFFNSVKILAYPLKIFVALTIKKYKTNLQTRNISGNFVLLSFQNPLNSLI